MTHITAISPRSGKNLEVDTFWGQHGLPAHRARCPRRIRDGYAGRVSVKRPTCAAGQSGRPSTRLRPDAVSSTWPPVCKGQRFDLRYATGPEEPSDPADPELRDHEPDGPAVSATSMGAV